ncbi:DNA internalization-related competence protein ComEC/Rec2 [Stenotrophomonas sp. 24(2023)]|uniref:DNA internalization-related competence protein ComEC/Rec2 n=1 Tax=Stenotrophomonas sp. 24(2023) TaxID=3068324 RepID=UPI0027DF4ADA|nr:DNA internalization-related competence protein ComEC/Rec2 [Stenotrophomonas sp. 24(2023)]WMJ68621.1 DNA internalization-related competence protein ComEC/Rec2 [Stenotrophomonas sp. 24(2023)]
MRFWSFLPQVNIAGRACAAALVAGALLCVQLPWLLPWPAGAGLVLAGLPGMCLHWRGRWLGAALFGLGWATVHAHMALQAQLPAGDPPRNVQVIGQVMDLPRHGPQHSRFLLRVIRCDALPALQGRRLQVSWHDLSHGARGGSAGDPSAARRTVDAGAHWQLPLRVRPPRGRINPGGIDGERQAVLAGLAGTAQVRQGLARQQQPAQGLSAWRQRLAARIGVQVPAGQARFVQALALGDTRGLQAQDWDALRALGLTHLIAISGFHVGLVAGFAALLVQLPWRLWPALPRRWPRPQVAAVAAAVGGAGYALLAGAELPTLRTAAMIALVALARAGRRPLAVGQALALAAIGMVLAAPLSVLAAGFWLSFGGVLWLLWCLSGPGARGLLATLRSFLAAQGVASLALLPLTVALFGQASLWGPLVNLPVIPWWSLVVVPLALLGTGLEAVWPGLGQGVLQLAATAFDASWRALLPLARHSGSVWWLPQAPGWAVPLALAGVFWALLPRGAGGALAAPLLCLPLLWPPRDRPAPGALALLVVDAGQGTAVLVRTARHALWYDLGPPGEDPAGRLLRPVAQALGQGPPQRLLLSHADADHAGGLPSARQQWPQASVLAPPGAGVPGAEACQQGLRWRWDGVDFQVLHPLPAGPYTGNESSCVLRIQTAHGSVLLAGDIGHASERRLLQAMPDALAARVVLVPHHGSAGSSSPAFVQAVAPQLALVSAGHGNRFGHPRLPVVQRWQAAGAEVLSTADAGAIHVWLGVQGLQVREQRVYSARWWDAVGRARAAAILSANEHAATGPEG